MARPTPALARPRTARTEKGRPGPRDRPSRSTGLAAGCVPRRRRRASPRLSRATPRSPMPTDLAVATASDWRGRQRRPKRHTGPAEVPDETKPSDGQAPAQAAIERGPDGRKSGAMRRLSKRGRPGGEELPKTDSAKTDSAKTEEPSKGEATDDKPKSEAAKDEGSKPEGATPPVEAKSESDKIETPKDSGGSTPVLPPDPRPPGS